MNNQEVSFAERLGRLRCESAALHYYDPTVHGDAVVLRQALRHAGVPVLELNNAPPAVAESWLAHAVALSSEYLVPVFVFGAAQLASAVSDDGSQQVVENQAWLAARQVALTGAIENSPINQEERRTRERAGGLYLGWQSDSKMAQGNVLMLAWSSPLPLRRIRDFSARCPDLVVCGPESSRLADDVAAQGISVARWRFEVK